MTTPAIKVEQLQSEDPNFEAGSSHTATASMTNPTAASFDYVVELYLDVTKVATSGQLAVSIAAGQTMNVNLPIVMPLVEGTFIPFLDVWVAGVLIAHYQATENVVLTVTPDIDIGDIVWT